jgi:hypothetical protein
MEEDRADMLKESVEVKRELNSSTWLDSDVLDASISKKINAKEVWSPYLEAATEVL